MNNRGEFMNLRIFLRDKCIYIILVFFVVISSEILLIPFEVVTAIKVYIGIIPIITIVISLLVEYYKKRNFYKMLEERLNALEEKYLISEVMSSPNFIEGKILQDCLQELGKSMIESVDKYKYLQNDYKEYIELWIHEIKIPIATGKMIIENNKSKITKSIDQELNKIDDYVEQALFYARSNNVEKDYYIKKTSLEEVVNDTLIKNKAILLENKVNINIHDLQYTVNTDNKWLVFILSQIIQNSIKYSKEGEKNIEIFGNENKESVTLHVKDNGIGIKNSELTKVFDKGFTGTNGRITGKKSTGIGLYLSKKLCNRLGLSINISSRENVGTEIIITFPKGTSFNEVLR